ncbi:inosine monophosphate dehydrogenase [Artomyces pyxidatus]|uniref:Inosine monophosphate dehydrogenase n=1 Tax=Artomyces pyxidatus TaxID=48021 RepID=A0ACB8SXP7_9AGAM|nr:inosine monophosphate dehydrogenase [Artomyces pyxidatus]
MSVLDTPLTRLLGIRTPLVLAPMAGASGGQLAAAVHLAGGFGFTAPTYTGLADFRAELALARAALAQPAGPLPIGAGFLGWKLDAGADAVALLDAALAARVRAVWLAFGADLARWAAYVRARAPGTLVFVQVNSVDDALRAVAEYSPDVLVAQGIESGGHGSATAPPILNLLPLVAAALPAGPPVLGAGGLSSGAHLAAFLALGAAGAVAGTRFLLTREATYAPAQKRAVQAAAPGATVRSTAFDALRGTLGWPAGVDGRALRMPAADALDAGGALDSAQRSVAAGMAAGDPAAFVTWAGTGVGALQEEQSAQDVVRALHDEAIVALRAAHAVLGAGDAPR